MTISASMRELIQHARSNETKQHRHNNWSREIVEYDFNSKPNNGNYVENC